MTTKLVYVLTCAHENNYIEQALLSVYSARHWNSDAQIVLITDNKTDSILTEKRDEILHYISEKAVVSFPDEASMMYRSRWLKTSVRNLIDGDFLFIDCDTIITSDLSSIESVDCELGMVLDEHLPTHMYEASLYKKNILAAKQLGWNFELEDEYFNSGVIFCRDTKKCREFYSQWHKNWERSEKIGIPIDQPSLGLTNLEFGHFIEQLPGIWNCQIYMRPIFAANSLILHFWSFRNESILFSNAFLSDVKEKGLSEFHKSFIQNPLHSIIPFRNVMSNYSFSDYARLNRIIRNTLIRYSKEIDREFNGFVWKNRLRTTERRLLRVGMISAAAFLIVLRLYFSIELLKRKDYSTVSFH